MKQTLEEAASKELFSSYACTSRNLSFAGLVYDRNAMLNMFRKGAEWHARQPLWISVEERLPEDFQKVLILRTYIGAKSRERRYEVFTQTFFKEYGFKICETRKNLKEKVLAWMPIPSFDEILEANRDVLERIKEKGD
jgi:hypothetical protein